MISERLKILLKELKLSQRQFAMKINLDAGYFSKIIQGKVKPPDRILLLIENVFNVNKNWLENGEGEIFCDKGISLAKKQALEIIDTFNNEQVKAVLAFINSLEEIEKTFPNIEKKVNSDEIKQKEFFDIFNGLSLELQDHLLNTAKDLLKTQQKIQSNNYTTNIYKSVDNVDKTVDNETEIAEELIPEEHTIKELEEEYKKTLHSAPKTTSTVLPTTKETIENTKENKVI